MQKQRIKVEKPQNKVNIITAIFIGMVIGLSVAAIFKLLDAKFF